MPAIILQKPFVMGSDAQVNARIYSWDRPTEPLVPDDIESVTYSIINSETDEFLVQDEEVEPEDIFSDELLGGQGEDPIRWRADNLGANFSHNIAGCKFTQACKCIVEWVIIGAAGEQLVIVSAGKIIQVRSSLPSCDEGSGS